MEFFRFQFGDFVNFDDFIRKKSYQNLSDYIQFFIKKKI